MNVLQVIPYFTPKRGGDVNVCYNISKHLSMLGHKVTIATTDFEFDENYAQELVKLGIAIIPFHCIFNFKLFLITPQMNGWLHTHISSFDVIHLHAFRCYQNILVHSFSKDTGVPYILQANGSVLRLSEKQNMKRIYDHLWGDNLLRDANGIIAVSKAEMGQYRMNGVCLDKVNLIPNGIHTERLLKPDKPAFFRSKAGIQNDCRIILYLGRLHKRKRIDLLIKAFSEVSKIHNDVMLVVAGEDFGQKAELERLTMELNLTDLVRFVGYAEDAFEAYQDAEVLVYPAVHEIFGLIPFEALLSGTISVVSDDCGCGEFIKEADCGYIAKSGDVEDFKRKILEALENPDKNQLMIKSGINYISNNLTWDAVTKKIADVYADVIL